MKRNILINDIPNNITNTVVQNTKIICTFQRENFYFYFFSFATHHLCPRCVCPTLLFQVSTLKLCFQWGQFSCLGDELGPEIGYMGWESPRFTMDLALWWDGHTHWVMDIQLYPIQIFQKIPSFLGEKIIG